jgi:hypothetical protein
VDGCFCWLFLELPWILTSRPLLLLLLLLQVWS